MLVVSLAVKESEAPAGEAHLFTPEPMTLCVYVCVRFSGTNRGQETKVNTSPDSQQANDLPERLYSPYYGQTQAHVHMHVHTV